MPARVRALVAVGMASMIAVLIWAAAHPTRRSWRDPAFVVDVTRQLSANERQSLEGTLKTLVLAAGVNDPIRLNQPAEHGSVNVYVVRPEQRALTGCPPGNAHYLSGADVLVIDSGVIWPTLTLPGYSSIAFEPDGSNASSRAWFYFTFLHELGHRSDLKARTLGSRLRQLRSSSPKPADEQVADDFATSALLNLPGEYSPGSSFHLPPRLSRTNAPQLDTPLTAEERRAATLAGLVYDFSMIALFSDASFSPYESDASHAAFVDRFRQRLRNSLIGDIRRDVAMYVLMALSYLQRVNDGSRWLEAEIRTPAPIVDVSARGDRVWINTSAGTSQSRYYDVVLPPQSSAPTKPTVLIASTSNSKSLPPASPSDERASISPDSVRHYLQSEYTLDDQEMRQCDVSEGYRGDWGIDVDVLCSNNYFSLGALTE